MTRKSFVRYLRVAAIAVPLFVVAWVAFSIVDFFFIGGYRTRPNFPNYERVQVGMTIEEVQAILGPGTPIEQADVPLCLAAVNPEDAVAAIEKEKRSGTVATGRTYPIRQKPSVQGDYILRWQTAIDRVYVAFKEGKVCEKYYIDDYHNYL